MNNLTEESKCREWCTCGHSREDHMNNLSAMVGIYHHGGCDFGNCECIKFTWTSKQGITETVSEITLREGVYEY